MEYGKWKGPDGFWIYLFYGFCSAYFFPDAWMVVFKTGKGELEGYGVLAGGQYDKLMKKMDRKDRAVGFAINLGVLAGGRGTGMEVQHCKKFCGADHAWCGVDALLSLDRTYGCAGKESSGICPVTLRSRCQWPQHFLFPGYPMDDAVGQMVQYTVIAGKACNQYLWIFLMGKRDSHDRKWK